MVNPLFQGSPSAPRIPQLVYSGLPHLLTTVMPSSLPTYIMFVSVFLESEDPRISWEQGSITQNNQVREHDLDTQQLRAKILRKCFLLPAFLVARGHRSALLSCNLRHHETRAMTVVICLTGSISYLYEKSHLIKATDKEGKSSAQIWKVDWDETQMQTLDSAKVQIDPRSLQNHNEITRKMLFSIMISHSGDIPTEVLFFFIHSNRLTPHLILGLGSFSSSLPNLQWENRDSKALWCQGKWQYLATPHTYKHNRRGHSLLLITCS